MNNPELDARIDQIAALGEPARRALYRYVAAQGEPVTREQAAAGVGVAHHVAKFHLDRLVADGLLQAEYRRPPGRGGPGAGRPAKVYRAAGELAVSLPERRYDLAGRLLVRAVGAAARSGAPVDDTLSEVARAAGRDVVDEWESADRRTSSMSRRLVGVLQSCGFEPATTGREVVLRNCPFHCLADEDRELVCGMNLSFVQGLLERVGADQASAALDSSSSGCCVRIAIG